VEKIITVVISVEMLWVQILLYGANCVILMYAILVLQRALIWLVNYMEAIYNLKTVQIIIK
jgi:hypothetical protein